MSNNEAGPKVDIGVQCNYEFSSGIQETIEEAFKKTLMDNLLEINGQLMGPQNSRVDQLLLLKVDYLTCFDWLESRLISRLDS